MQDLLDFLQHEAFLPLCLLWDIAVHVITIIALISVDKFPFSKFLSLHI